MFTFFKRVKTVVSSELNAMLDRAEDPVKMLDQYLRDMAEDIREVEAAVAKQIANEKMLKRKMNDAKALVEKRQEQAEKAVESGNDELARRALQDKRDHEATAKALQETWEQARDDVEDLRTKLDEMKREYQEMVVKRDTLKARAESAKTKTKINRSMSMVGNDDAKRGFERMEEKVLQFEAEAETSEDLSIASRSLDDELEEIVKDDVDDELSALKEKLGKE